MPRISRDEAAAAAWIALANVAGKEGRRDLLTAGAKYSADLIVTGEVNGVAFERRVETTTTVGHDQEKLSSAAPDTVHLVAYLLGEFSAAARKRLLERLPVVFAAAEQTLPDVPVELAEQAEALLKQLRSQVQKTYRGAVSTSYQKGAVQPL